MFGISCGFQWPRLCIASPVKRRTTPISQKLWPSCPSDPPSSGNKRRPSERASTVVIPDFLLFPNKPIRGVYRCRPGLSTRPDHVTKGPARVRSSDRYPRRWIRQRRRIRAIIICWLNYGNQDRRVSITNTAIRRDKILAYRAKARESTVAKWSQNRPNMLGPKTQTLW